MKIVIVGPGALGCLLATHLAARANQEIWLLDRQSARAALLAAQPLLLISDGRELVARVRATAKPEEIGPAELIILCVKSHQVAAALNLCGPLHARDGLLLALPNGIAHLEPLGALPPDRPWAVGTTAQGATLMPPNRVVHGGHGPTQLGFISNPSPPARAILEAAAALFTHAGLPTTIVPGIIAALWGKLLINVGINALTALHDCANGNLLAIPAAATMLAEAVEEGAAIARAKGISLPAEPVAACRTVCMATGANLSSMLQDVRARRPTEIAAINGAIVREGAQLGLPTPINSLLLHAVTAIERGYSGNLS